MKKIWRFRSTLEVLRHHCRSKTGQVWDGDQICKQTRDQLIQRGFLQRINGGFTIATDKGREMWARWEAFYRLLTWVQHLKWRIQDLVR